VRAGHRPGAGALGFVGILYPTPAHAPRMYPVVAHAPCVYCYCVPSCSYVTVCPKWPGWSAARAAVRAVQVARYLSTCLHHYIAFMSLCPLTHTPTPCIHTCMCGKHRCMYVRLGARLPLCIDGTSLPHISRVDIYTGTGTRYNYWSPPWIILRHSCQSVARYQDSPRGASCLRPVCVAP
jgi:hypothetical protein